jgi:hypothetical protein
MGSPREQDLMKHLRLAIAIATVCAAAACGRGGGSDPSQPAAPKKDPMVVASGTFDVTSQLQIDGCALATELDSTYSIQIDSTSCSMKNWTGTWDATKGYAMVQSPVDVTVARYCTVRRSWTAYITFRNPDEFTATVLYRMSLAGDCQDRVPCSSSWILVGTRRPAALNSN